MNVSLGSTNYNVTVGYTPSIKTTQASPGLQGVQGITGATGATGAENFMLIMVLGHIMGIFIFSSSKV